MNVSRLIRIVLRLTLLLTTLAASAAAQTVAFSFNPPDSLCCTQVLTTVKKMYQGEQPARVDSSVLRSNICQWKTETGYTVLAKPESTAFFRGGKAQSNPIVDALSSAEITYQLNPQGRILGVIGYGDVIKRIEATLPPQALEIARGMLNEDALTAKETAEYDSRVGEFIGAVFECGEPLMSESHYDLPSGGQITYQAATQVTDMRRCHERNCARVVYIFHSDSARLSTALNSLELKDSTGSPVSINSVDSDYQVIAGYGERLIDPQTMLIYSEHNERTVQFQMTTPGQMPFQVRMEETRTYEFIYE